MKPSETKTCYVVAPFMVILRISNTLTLIVIVTAFLGGMSSAWSQTRQLSASSYVERGNDWYKKGEFKRAMADLDIALTFDSRFAPAYVLRGLIRQRMGDADGALDDFSRAIESQPRLFEAYHNRAAVHILKK